MDTRKAAPATVGAILLEEFINSDLYSLAGLAENIDMTVGQLTEILSDKRQLTDCEAKRLGIYLKTGEDFWKNIRDSYIRWEKRMGIIEG